MAIGALLRRFAQIATPDEDPPTFYRNPAITGPKRLPLECQPVR